MALLFSLLAFSRHPLKSQHRQRVTVAVDPRFEALSLFYMLAVTDSLEDDEKPTPSPYYRDVKQYFSGCRNHPSLLWYRSLDRMDGFDIPSLGIFLSHPPRMYVQKKMEISYLRSTPDINVFLEKLNAFYADCGVGAFLEAHRKLYSKVAADFRDSLGKSSLLADIEHFYGGEKVTETVIFLDLLNNIGNNAIPLKSVENRGKLLIRIGYISFPEDRLTDSSPIRFAPPLNVIAHECSHLFTDDFTEIYKDRLYRIKSVFLPPEHTDGTDEENWENEVEELLVRACVAKVLALRDGERQGEQEVKAQAGHYKHIPGLYQLLNSYVNNRSKYGQIKDFYPEIIRYLESLYDKRL